MVFIRQVAFSTSTISNRDLVLRYNFIGNTLGELLEKVSFVFIFVFKIYIFILEREREYSGKGQRERERQSQANSLLSAEPYVGLPTMTPRS